MLFLNKKGKRKNTLLHLQLYLLIPRQIHFKFSLLTKDFLLCTSRNARCVPPHRFKPSNRPPPSTALITLYQSKANRGGGVGKHRDGPQQENGNAKQACHTIAGSHVGRHLECHAGCKSSPTRNEPLLSKVALPPLFNS